MGGKLPLLIQFRLRDPNTQRDKVPDNEKDDDGGNQDAKNITCHDTGGMGLKVKKRIHIESLSGVCEVSQAKIEG